MRIKRLWRGVATGVAAVLIGTVLVVPAWAAQSMQVDDPVPDAYAAMHEACEVGDVQGMTGAMDSVIGEDRQTMEEHMKDEGHFGAMSSGMTNMSEMMGGWLGWLGWSGVWSGMMAW